MQFSPRFVMEAIGMSLIAIIAYVMTQKAGVVGVLPMLDLAISAQRLLPSLQQAYSAYTAISGSIPALEDIIILLKQPLGINQNDDTDNVKFKDEICLRDISFRRKRFAVCIEEYQLTIKRDRVLDLLE